MRQLASILRDMGHEVDCFADKSTGRFVFSWRDISKNIKDLDIVKMLKHDKGIKAFKEDKKWLDWADCVVMLLPCGNSSHLEAGYIKGQGKKLIILGHLIKGDFDVMYGFADKFVAMDDNWPEKLKECLEDIP